MSREFIVRRGAEHDIAETCLWYETRRPGSAVHFIRCVDAAMALIARHPQAAPIQFGVYRRILVSRFPFAIFYTAEATSVVVHALYHLSRNPDKIRQSLESGESTA